jgi:sporulation protein YlmC with PRC-barrel domain
VRNPQGENLGKIEDLVLDVGSQRVRYAVLSFGGALGFGDKLFAYPINAFRGAPDADTLILNVDKERLRKAPGFDAGRWPDWSQRGYRSEVDRYFGTSGTPKAPSGQRLVRASELIGKDVDDASGRDAGEVEDVVINIGQGRVHFVVLDFDKAWSPDDKLLPMGMNALKMPADWTNDLVLNVPREQLDMSRGFDETGWPDFNAGGWRRDMDTYLKNLHGAEKSAAR